MAIGKKWQRWTETGVHMTINRLIPEKHRQKVLMEQDADGQYNICQPIMEKINKHKD